MTDQNYLQKYLSLNKGTEIPDVFALWCGLSAVSIVLGRSVWLDMGTYVIYPNLFVVLVAGSGRCRKSTAIKIAERLVVQLEPPPKLIAQRITPEALIKALQPKGPEEKGSKEPTKILSGSAVGYVIVDELANFLNRKTYEGGLCSLLIPLYDCNAAYEYHTIGRGVERLENTCLGLLGASTIDWIRNAIPPDAIGAGLTSRILFVYVESPPPPVAITSFSDEKHALVYELVKDLQRIQAYKGEVKLTEDAWLFYRTTYEDFYENSELYAMPMLQGYASRRHVHWLKAAILLAASDGSETESGRLLVEHRHLDGALALLETCEKTLPQVISLIAASERGVLLEEVYTRIAGSGKISRKALTKSMQHKLDIRGLGDILQSLRSSERIGMSSGKGGVFYWIPKAT